MIKSSSHEKGFTHTNEHAKPSILNPKLTAPKWPCLVSVVLLQVPKQHDSMMLSIAMQAAVTDLISTHGHEGRGGVITVSACPSAVDCLLPCLSCSSSIGLAQR